MENPEEGNQANAGTDTAGLSIQEHQPQGAAPTPAPATGQTIEGQLSDHAKRLAAIEEAPKAASQEELDALKEQLQAHIKDQEDAPKPASQADLEVLRKDLDDAGLLHELAETVSHKLPEHNEETKAAEGETTAAQAETATHE